MMLLSQYLPEKEMPEFQDLAKKLRADVPPVQKGWDWEDRNGKRNDALGVYPTEPGQFKVTVH